MNYDLDAIEALCRVIRIRVTEHKKDELVLDLGAGFLMALFNDKDDCQCSCAVGGNSWGGHFHGDFEFYLEDLHGEAFGLTMSISELLSNLATGEVLLVEVHRGLYPPDWQFLYRDGGRLWSLDIDEHYVVRRAQLLGP